MSDSENHCMTWAAIKGQGQCAANCRCARGNRIGENRPDTGIYRTFDVEVDLSLAPECFGGRICPRNRDSCKLNKPCLDHYVHGRLQTGMSPTNLRASLAKVLDDTDFILLRNIGIISLNHGYKFGWKKVQRAIEESSLDEEYDGKDLRAVKSEVRLAFGVHGREGRRAPRVIPPARNMPIGNTEEDYSVVEALCDGGTHVE